MSTWSNLPSGQDLVFAPGYFYGATAEVKASHTQADILKLAADKGLTVINYQDNAALDGQTPASGYRFIALTGQATKVDSIPWKVPFPLSLGDSSHVIQAWAAPPDATAPALPVAAPAGGSMAAWAVGSVLGVGAALGAWWLLKHR